jgi:hypothetical protein
MKKDLVVVLQENTHLEPIQNEVPKLYLFREDSVQEDDTFHMIDYSHAKDKNSPLLYRSLATVISSVSKVTTFGLRVANFTFGTVFDSLKFSAAASLGLGIELLTKA